MANKASTMQQDVIETWSNSQQVIALKKFQSYF